MTENKPIMIDGVDVSGCEHLYREIDCLAHIDFSECCEGYNHSYGYCPNIDCYFKQLHRKTQECEELKKQLIQKDEVNTFFNTPIEGWDNDPCKICESKQNYDQIKIDKAKLEAQIEADTQYHIKEENTLRKIIKNKEERNIELYKENNKLKQTLTEIKEMCNSEVCDYIQCSLNYNHSEDFECEKTSCGRAHRRKFILEILQKISECEAEDAR